MLDDRQTAAPWPTAYPQGYAVVDVETTGLARDDRIISAAVYRLDALGNVEDHWYTLANPERDPGPVWIHGLTSDVLEGAPLFPEVAAELSARLADRVLVAHNAAFDWSMIAREYARASVIAPVEQRLCTIALAKELRLPLPNHKLASLAAHFGVVQQNAHTPHDAGPGHLHPAARPPGGSPVLETTTLTGTVKVTDPRPPRDESPALQHRRRRQRAPSTSAGLRLRIDPDREGALGTPLRTASGSRSPDPTRPAAQRPAGRDGGQHVAPALSPPTEGSVAYDPPGTPRLAAAAAVRPAEPGAHAACCAKWPAERTYQGPPREAGRDSPSR
ncbi:3'-5' exonuclease DinG [Streptomyces microflavus]